MGMPSTANIIQIAKQIVNANVLLARTAMGRLSVLILFSLKSHYRCLKRTWRGRARPLAGGVWTNGQEA
jgi:hypothetical protein